MFIFLRVKALKAPLPPQLAILAIIAKNSNGLTFKEIIAYVDYICKYNLLKEYCFDKGGNTGILSLLIYDIITLRKLNLVREVNGRFILSDKGYSVLKKATESSNTLKSIMNLKV